MKSKMWLKHRRPKSKFRTKVIEVGGKGTNIVGHIAALASIQAERKTQNKKPLVVARTMHTRYEWVFCEPR